MSLQNFLDSENTTTRQSVFGLQSLREYSVSLLTKFEEILGGEETRDDSFIILPLQVGDDNYETACQVSTNAIKQALNESVSTVDVIIGSNGATATIDAQSLCSQVENNVSNLRVQTEFISAMLSGAAKTTESFTSMILSKFPAISGEQVDVYARYLDCGDPILALKTWVNDIKAGDLIEDGNTIKLYKKSDYTGSSVWLIVITDFKNTITGFFSKVWQGIQDIAGMFQRLWMAITDLATWVLMKVAQPLTTNLTKGDADIGILDIPILSCCIAKVDNNNNIIPASISNNISTITTKLDTTYLLLVPEQGDNTNIAIASSFTGNMVAARVRKLLGLICASSDVDVLKYQTIDHVYYDDTYSKCAIIIRLGLVPKDGIYLQIFFGCAKSMYGNIKDREVFSLMKNALAGFIVHLRPFTLESYEPSSSYWRLQKVDSETFLSPLDASESSSDGPIDFVSHMRYWSIEEMMSDDWDPGTGRWISRGESCFYWILTCLMPYLAIIGQSGDNIGILSNGVIDDSCDGSTVMSNDVIYAADLFRSNSQFRNTELSPMDNTISVTWNDDYRPYLKQNLYACALHYQNLQEQADEIEIYIIAVLAAIAVTVIAVKAHKAISNLRAKAIIARGTADNFSWNVGVNPTADQIAQYKKLNRVANRYERMSSLFGGTSAVSLAQSIKDRVFDNNESIGKSMDDVYNVIKGPVNRSFNTPLDR